MTREETQQDPFEFGYEVRSFIAPAGSILEMKLAPCRGLVARTASLLYEAGLEIFLVDLSRGHEAVGLKCNWKACTQLTWCPIGTNETATEAYVRWRGTLCIQHSARRSTPPTSMPRSSLELELEQVRRERDSKAETVKDLLADIDNRQSQINERSEQIACLRELLDARTKLLDEAVKRTLASGNVANATDFENLCASLDEHRANIALLRGEIAAIRELQKRPIPMRITCPRCNTLHVDEGPFAEKPHHTHACQSCGEVWRPCKAHTVGVRFLPGYKNEPK